MDGSLPNFSERVAYPSLTDYGGDVYSEISLFTFIETKVFSRLADEFLPDDQLARLQQHLIANPEAGDIVRESGGVRKLRWGATGRGKRGGLRIIYYLRSTQGEIWLLTLYAKNMAESISGRTLRKIKEEIDG
jgi:mRNA-degrading endonuclease RelE of RelBE toxin-antitoxin system